MHCACYILSAAVFIICVRKYQEYKWKYCKNSVSLRGKTAVVTGANSGIGYEIAKELAKRGAKVILACRNVQYAEEAISRIKKSLDTPYQLISMQLDLSSLKSIKSFAEAFNNQEEKLDLLINNAGVSFPKTELKKTADDFEVHFGVNHLGHFLLTELLLPKLKKKYKNVEGIDGNKDSEKELAEGKIQNFKNGDSEKPEKIIQDGETPGRIIVISSKLHEKGSIFLDDLNRENKKSKTPAYNDSKLANAYFAQELAKRVKKYGINVYTVCPGWVYTGLFRNYSVQWYHYILVAPIAFIFMRTPKQGAQTAVYCATDSKLDSETGFFYKDCGRYKSRFNFDPNTGEKLWDLSQNMIESRLKLL